MVITLLLPNNNDSIDDPGDDKYNFTLEDPQYYFDLVNQAFSLSDSELELLDNNKFIVLNRYGTDDIMDAYKYCWMNDLPIIITTDAMLHTWHLVFDNILERVEEQIFFPLFCHLAESITPQALVEFNNGLIQNKSVLNLSLMCLF